MEKNKDRELDLFLKDAIKAMSLDKVSKDFTADVLYKIELEREHSKALYYKPLISKQIWGMILLLFLGLCIYLVLGGNIGSSVWWEALKMNMAENFDLVQRFSNFQVNENLVYGAVILAFFVLLQVIYLKRYFADRNVVI
ncbi:hypothetical protein [Maribacter sp. 2304DJ31-5]|uniref:hypothetical protein n=1 Tax=Maribacter sp. 2304DJ31-5 TaxID=3386273 RepID=UPI0039BCDE40